MTRAISATGLGRCRMAATAGTRAYSLLLGIPMMACSGVFIGENAHSDRRPALYLQQNALAGGIGPASRVWGWLAGIKPSPIDEGDLEGQARP